MLKNKGDYKNLQTATIHHPSHDAIDVQLDEEPLYVQPASENSSNLYKEEDYNYDLSHLEIEAKDDKEVKNSSKNTPGTSGGTSINDDDERPDLDEEFERSMKVFIQILLSHCLQPGFLSEMIKDKGRSYTLSFFRNFSEAFALELWGP